MKQFLWGDIWNDHWESKPEIKFKDWHPFSYGLCLEMQKETFKTHHMLAKGKCHHDTSQEGIPVR